MVRVPVAIDAAAAVTYPVCMGGAMHTIAVAVLAVLVSASTAPADPSGFADASADKVHAAVSVPEPARKVGEVRLLSRGDAVVVQTLLSTKLLGRVVGEIRQKEEGNWPKDSEDTRAYLMALEAAREKLEKRDVGPDWRDRRHRMLIEFIADASGHAVLVGTYKVSGEGNVVPASRELFSTLTPSRPYVLGNIRLILADSFDVAPAEVDKLGPLGPASLAAAPAPGGTATPAPGAAAAPAPGGAGN